MAAYYPVNMIHPQYQHAIPLDNEHSTPVGNGAGGVIHPNIETNEPVLPGRFAAQVALHPGEATYSGRAAKSPGAHGSGSSTTASRPVGLRSAGSNLVHTGMGGLGALENPNTISQQNPFATGIYSPFVLAPENPTSALRNPPRAAFPTVLNQIGREQQRLASPGFVLTRTGAKVHATTHDLGIVVDASSYAEAIGTSKAGETVEEARAIERALGIPPTAPTIVLTDNRSSAAARARCGRATRCAATCRSSSAWSRPSARSGSSRTRRTRPTASPRRCRTPST